MYIQQYLNTTSFSFKTATFWDFWASFWNIFEIIVSVWWDHFLHRNNNPAHILIHIEGSITSTRTKNQVPSLIWSTLSSYFWHHIHYIYTSNLSHFLSLITTINVYFFFWHLFHCISKSNSSNVLSVITTINFHS